MDLSSTKECSLTHAYRTGSLAFQLVQKSPGSHWANATDTEISPGSLSGCQGDPHGAYYRLFPTQAGKTHCLTT